MVQKGYRRRHCTLWCLSAQSWTGSHLYEQLTLPASSGPEWASLCPCSMHLACLNQGGCGFSDLSCDWPLSALSSNFLRVLLFLQSIEQLYLLFNHKGMTFKCAKLHGWFTLMKALRLWPQKRDETFVMASTVDDTLPSVPPSGFPRSPKQNEEKPETFWGLSHKNQHWPLWLTGTEVPSPASRALCEATFL